MNSEVKKLFFPFIIFFLEWIGCYLALQPTLETDVSLVSIFLLIINIFVVFASFNLFKIDSKILPFIYLSFLLRLVILLWDVYCRDILILPNSEADAIWYHLRGTWYAFTKMKGEVNFKDYAYYVSLLYKMIGVQKITAQFLNVYFALISICIVYKICELLDISYQIKKKCIQFLCFLPNSAMITTFFLYESLISFLIILAFYMFTLWWKNRKKEYFVLSMLISGYAGMFHVGGIVVALGIFLSYPIINNKDRIPDLSVNNLSKMFMFFLIGVIFLSVFSGTYLRKVGGDVSVENISHSAEELYAEGGSAYSSSGSGEGIIHFIVNTPIRMVYFVVAPMPWMWRGVKDILAFLGSASFFAYNWFSLYKFYKSRNTCSYELRKHYWGYLFVISVILVISSIMFAWGVSNAGSALRHREKFIYLYGVMFALTQELAYRLSKQQDTRYE